MTNKINLLLIEDSDADATWFIRSCEEIESIDFRFQRRTSVKNLLEDQPLSEIDIIVADLDLPDAKQLEVVDSICNLQLKAPVVVLTGYEDESLLNQAAELGVDDFLNKDEINAKTLKRCLRYTLKRHELSVRNSKLQQQLQQAQKMEAIGQLTGGIAHDINNKLAILKASALTIENARKSGADDSAQIQVLLDVIDGVSNMTGQLLAFGRKQEMIMKVSDINQIVGNSVKLLERVLGPKVNIVADYAAQLPEVEVDPIQIDQMVMNLVLNARDAIEESGSIRIKTEKVKDFHQTNQGDLTSSEFIRLSVQDNGAGIKSDSLSKVFDPFYTTKDIGKGTGLGLSVVHGIVEKHGGKVSVESRLGEGTTFAVDLKVARSAGKVETQPTSEPHQVSQPAPDQGGGDSPTILYAEDEPLIREMVSNLLRAKGFKVLEAENGLEALQVFRSKHDLINVVLSDARMPEMDGKELYTALQEIVPNFPFIYTSGFSNGMLTEDGPLPPNTFFIPKPINYNELMKMLQEACRSRQALQSPGAA